MLGFYQRLPSGFVQSEEGVVIDPMALNAILPYDLPYRTIRPVHFRPRRSPILCGERQGRNSSQNRDSDQNSGSHVKRELEIGRILHLKFEIRNLKLDGSNLRFRDFGI